MSCVSLVFLSASPACSLAPERPLLLQAAIRETEEEIGLRLGDASAFALLGATPNLPRNRI